MKWSQPKNWSQKRTNKSKTNMATVKFNGQTYVGSNITITNGRVIIDGKDETPEGKHITISVEGDIQQLSVDTCHQVTVNGSCGSARSTSGDIKCGEVKGDVGTTSGDIKCGHVGGSVRANSGDIECGVVLGSVSTNSGDIENDALKSEDLVAFIAKRAPELLEEYKKVLA